MTFITRSLLLFAVASPCVLGQPYQVTLPAMGHGARSSGGSFTVVGKPEASAMQGGSFAVVGGIGSMVVAVQVSGAPTLGIARAENGFVLSWTTAESFILEFTDDLRPTSSWGPVEVVPFRSGDRFSANLPVAPGRTFFRLRKQ